MILTRCASGASTGANGTTTTPGTQSATLTAKNFMGKTYQIGDSKSTLTFTTRGTMSTASGMSAQAVDTFSWTEDDGRVELHPYRLALTSAYQNETRDYEDMPENTENNGYSLSAAYAASDQCPVLSSEDDDIDPEDTPWKACAENTIFVDAQFIPSHGYSSLRLEESYYVTLHEGKLTMTQLAYDPEDPNYDTPKDFQRQQKLTNNFVALTPVTAKH